MERLGVDVRRFGSGLLAFGLVGLVVAGIVAVGLFAGALSARSLEDSLANGRASAVEALEAVSTSLGHAAETTGNLGTTLQTTQQTLADTSATLTSLADTSAALAGGLDFNVLGQQPLAGAASQFTALAERLRTFATSSSTLSANLGQNREDLVAITTDLQELQRQVDKAIAGLQDDSSSRLVALMTWGVLLLAALCAWVAAAAGLCAWVGWRLRRPVAVVATPLGPGDAASPGA